MEITSVTQYFATIFGISWKQRGVAGHVTSCCDGIVLKLKMKDNFYQQDGGAFFLQA